MDNYLHDEVFRRYAHVGGVGVFVCVCVSSMAMRRADTLAMQFFCCSSSSSSLVHSERANNASKQTSRRTFEKRGIIVKGFLLRTAFAMCVLVVIIGSDGFRTKWLVTKLEAWCHRLVVSISLSLGICCRCALVKNNYLCTS